jgi:hypothetical protein
VRQGGVERTLDNSLDKDTYLRDVAERYGINLRGSGQDISVVYDPDLGAGTLGVTRGAEGGRVIRVGPDGIFDDVTAANTIAHELTHARYYLKHGTFDGQEHGNGDSLADGTPYGSKNADVILAASRERATAGAVTAFRDAVELRQSEQGGSRSWLSTRWMNSARRFPTCSRGSFSWRGPDEDSPPR